VDEKQGQSDGEDDEESSAPEDGPALTFGEDEGSALPHWSDPPTGELPVVLDPDAQGDDAGVSRSRLFPEIPDDPNLVDESGTAVFAPVPPVPPGPTGAGEGAVSQAGPGGEPSPFAPPEQAPPEQVPPAPPAPESVPEAGLQEQAWGVPPSPGFETGAGAAVTSSGTAAAPGSALPPAAAPGTPAPETVSPPGQAVPPAQRPQAQVPPAPQSPTGPAHAQPAAATTGGGGDVTDDEALEAWSALDTSGPHWREEASHWDEDGIAPTDPESERSFFGEDGEAEAAPMTGDDSPRYDEAAIALGSDQGGGRDVPVALVTGLAIAVVFLVLMWIGPGATMFLLVPLLAVAAAEFLVSVRRVGYRPATLLGLATVVGWSLAAFWKGIEAYPAVLAVFVVAGFTWYLVDADGERPTPNFAITALGVLWVGGLGSFAALMLAVPTFGTGLLLGAVVTTVAYDVGGYVIGRTTGQSRLAPHISPNKTWEGLIGGMIVAVLTATVVFGFIGVAPWDGDTIDAVLLGIVVALAAPLGDLAQSLVKRDLAIKDMGHLLPGHGGLMDRFDGMVFSLPAVYYLARVVIF